MAEYPPLIRALCNPVLHGTADIRVVETHISWVLLAGDYAYKIKKPVDFGFLNFSSLALRRKYCFEELRLNRRLAPDLYLAVVAITGEPSQPHFDGEGPVLEYAVKLKRFDESALADRLIGTKRMTSALIDGLARELAVFHDNTARSTLQDTHGSLETLLAAAEHNFGHLQQIFPHYQHRWEALSVWTELEFKQLEERFVARKREGFIRECHGDLHCGNLVLIDGRLIPFDGIEFSEDLRWIDCLSELAFLFMDMEVRGQADLAWRLLNRYLEMTGDYAGLPVLDYYRVYRALVRAKIAALSFQQTGNPALENQCLAYLDYAEKSVRTRVPLLLITRGFSGSGKSYSATFLAERLPAIRIASDIERKRLAGLEALARTHSQPSGGIYSEDFTLQTYALLRDLAEQILKAGFSVILDATFLRKVQRDACCELAVRLGLSFFILDFHASEAVLRGRIAWRAEQGVDPSETNQSVLTHQIAIAEDLDSVEKPFVLALSTEIEPDLDAVASQLKGGSI